ncbi:MAG: hypothetical protein ACRD0P_26420 [Stackebrandtia sp.]
MAPEWTTKLNDLLAGHHTDTGDPLDAGAELLITEPDGTGSYRAALARHHRREPDPPAVLWLRPIHGADTDPATGRAVYNLNIARRRGITYTSIEIDGDSIRFRLPSGQTACIRPATGDTLVELKRWDEFTYLTLTAEEETALDALDADSWHGRFG